MTSKFTTWKIVKINAENGQVSGLPQAIVVPRGPEESLGLPPEVRLLLPTYDEPNAWFTQANAHMSGGDDLAVAVFAADPFFNLSAFVSTVKASGIQWVCNLPTIAQHDPEFIAQLQEVMINYAREMEVLTGLSEKGLKFMACVAGPEDAKLAEAAGASALFVLPQVHEIKEGFPSLQSRQMRAASIRAAIEPAEIPILTFLTAQESADPARWPEGVDGFVVRPPFGCAPGK